MLQKVLIILYAFHFCHSYIQSLVMSWFFKTSKGGESTVLLRIEIWYIYCDKFSCSFFPSCLPNLQHFLAEIQDHYFLYCLTQTQEVDYCLVNKLLSSLKTVSFLFWATLILILMRLPKRSMGFPSSATFIILMTYILHFHHEPRSSYKKQPESDEIHNDNVECIFWYLVSDESKVLCCLSLLNVYFPGILDFTVGKATVKKRIWLFPGLVAWYT